MGEQRMDGETNQAGDLWTIFFREDQFWRQLMKLVKD